MQKTKLRIVCRSLVITESLGLCVHACVSVCVQTQTPTNRKGHSAVVVGSAMLLYGGFVDMKGSSQDFWSLDFGEFELLLLPRSDVTRMHRVYSS